MTNVCGKVVRIGPPPPSSEGSALARRTIGLRYGDYEYDVQLLGSSALGSFSTGDSIMIFSVRKSLYCGVAALETTRLSWTLGSASWMVVPDGTGPARKAMKVEVLTPVSVNHLKNQTQACATNARLGAVDDSIFDCNIWVSDQKLRVPITLRDLSGSVEATLWGEQLLLDQRLSLSCSGDLLVRSDPITSPSVSTRGLKPPA